MHILLYSKSGLEMENSGMESCCISFHLYRKVCSYKNRIVGYFHQGKYFAKVVLNVLQTNLFSRIW